MLPLKTDLVSASFTMENTPFMAKPTVNAAPRSPCLGSGGFLGLFWPPQLHSIIYILNRIGSESSFWFHHFLSLLSLLCARERREFGWTNAEGGAI